MSKKRVHELAKEMGLDNREVLLALQAAGLPVKTHSSTVEVSAAMAVFKKNKDARPAATSPAIDANGPKRPGMMIVKKRRDIEAEKIKAAQEQAEFESTQQNNEKQHDLTQQDHRSEDQQETNEVEASQESPLTLLEVSPNDTVAKSVDIQAAKHADTGIETSPTQQQASFASTQTQKVDSPVVSQKSPKVIAAVPVPSVAPKNDLQSKPQPSHHLPKQQTPAAHSASSTSSHTPIAGYQGNPNANRHRPSGDHRSSNPRGQQPQATAAAGHRRPQEPRNTPATSAPASTSGSDGTAARITAPTKPGSATVVRMIDRNKLMERVPGRRLGFGGNQSGARPGGGGGTYDRGAPRPNNGPGGYRPQGQRPPAGSGGPSFGPGRDNQQRFGQVTELKVVTDPYSRNREMVSVGNRGDKKGKALPTGANNTSTKSAAAKPTRGRSSPKRDTMDMRERSMHPARLRKKKSSSAHSSSKAQSTQPKASKRVIKMKESIVVADLAHQMGIKAADIILKLMNLGMMITQNQNIDLETAQLIATDYEYTVDSIAFAEKEHLITSEDPQEDTALQESRAPIVTIMGHVDHGKTSLLDAIRKARVASGEAGGITQHIGAYSVDVKNKGSVTFLDTPGHAAFTSMRARGAQVTDIVVLVVAADDGVMPQTEEAIKHAQAAKVPIIVAVNKIDKPDANADRVMQELTQYQLLPEAWGGETLYINTSATKGTGIAELLEAILLQAEVLELRSNPNKAAQGVVIEAKLDRGRGPVATVLVQQGTLKRGDAIVIGHCYGKIRAMTDDQGKQLNTAGPSKAVEITGFDQVPEAGDNFNAVENTEVARNIAEHRISSRKASELNQQSATSLDDLMKRMKGADDLELKVVLKADVQGSLEALKGALLKLATEEVKVNIVYGGVGAIKESDVMLAAASGGLVLGFGVRPDPNARQIAERQGVEIRNYNIIYEAVDDVKKAMEGLLSPEAKEKIIGRAAVREIFKISKVGTIGGCRVTEGKAMRSAKVRILRDSVQVYNGKINSLKHFKSDAREVDTGLECGLGVEGFNDIKIGDIFEFYQIEEIARTLSDSISNKAAAAAAAASNASASV